jgi:hypothetical protein
LSTEPQPRWQRSTYSGQNAQCVEVANAPTSGMRLVRDSKLGENSPILEVSPRAFAALLSTFRNQ